jgi:hypothetical protein
MSLDTLIDYSHGQELAKPKSRIAHLSGPGLIPLIIPSHLGSDRVRDDERETQRRLADFVIARHEPL